MAFLQINNNIIKFGGFFNNIKYNISNKYIYYNKIIKMIVYNNKYVNIENI
jgi:hypothetical protein